MTDPVLKLTYSTALGYFQQGELAKALTLSDKLMNPAEKQDLGSYLMCAELICGLYLEADLDHKAWNGYQGILRKLEPLMKQTPHELVIETLLSSCYAGLGRIYLKRLRYKKAIDWLSKRYELTRRWLAELSEEVMTLPQREHFHAVSCEQLGQVYLQTEDAAEALKYGLEFNTIMKRLYSNDRENAVLVFGLITSYIHLGRAYMLNKDKDKSSATLIAGLGLSDEYDDQFGDSYEHSGPLLVLLEALGEFYATEQHYEKAVPYFLRQYTVIKKLSVLNKEALATNFNIGCAACKLADGYVALKMTNDALPYLQQAEEIFTTLTQGPEAHLSHYHNLYYCYATYIEYHKDKDDLPEAIKSAEQTVGVLKKIFDMSRRTRRYRNLLGKHYRILAGLYRDQQQMEKARVCDMKVHWLIRRDVSIGMYFRIVIRRTIYGIFKV